MLEKTRRLMSSCSPLLLCLCLIFLCASAFIYLVSTITQGSCALARKARNLAAANLKNCPKIRSKNNSKGAEICLMTVAQPRANRATPYLRAVRRRGHLW